MNDFDDAIADARPPLPLLITGVAGTAGYNAFHYFRARYPGRVIGIRPSTNWRLNHEGIVACDMADREALRQLFDQHRFAAVLNSEGSCALKACELDPDMAWRINVAGVENLLELVRARGTRLVHLSIDLVYAGRARGGYRETDPTDPVTIYGQTMVAAEQRVMAAVPESCILRISLPMGISFNGHAGAIDWIESRFKKGRPATLYFDEVRTPTYTDCLNRLFEIVLSRSIAGLYHAGGPRRLSLYQIAQIINRVGGYAPELLMGIPRHQAGPIPPRAGNVTMDSSRLSDAIGLYPFDPWPLDDELVPTDRDWHQIRPTGFPASPQRLMRVLCRHPRRDSPGWLSAVQCRTAARRGLTAVGSSP